MTNLVANFQQDNFKAMYQKHGINYLGLFGSYARNEEDVNSDIDLLVSFNNTKTLFDLADVKIFFQDKLGKKVDLVMKDDVKKALKPYIMKDIITIYEKLLS